jgi:transposase
VQKDEHMSHYSEERKTAVLKKLLPPHNHSIIEISREEGISEATLYNWRNKARQQPPPPLPDKPIAQYPAEAKFTVVIETALMIELKLSAYCLTKCFYPKQIQQ